MDERPVIKRKFAYIGAGWAAGLMLFLFLGAFSAAGIALSVAAACAVHVKRAKQVDSAAAAARYALLMAVSALAGALFFMGFSETVYSPLRALDGQTVTVEGTVRDTYKLPWGDTRLTVKGSVNGIRTKAFVTTRGEFSCGDHVTAEIKAAVTGNGDEDTYRSLGVFVSGRGTAVKTGKRSAVIYGVRAFRERALAGIYENCGEKTGAFIASILCSDKSHLSAETRRDVNRAGIGHIFAVSGTHIVMLTYFLSRILGRFVSSLRLRSVIMGAVIALFAVFAGCNVPVVRACIMLGISLAAAIFEREPDSANSLGVAVFVVTLANPYAISSVSFMLSFTAAAAFGVLSPAMTKGRTEHSTAKLLISCMCVSLLTMPICAVTFGEVSVISAVSNMVMIPLCSLCLYIAFIFTLTGGLAAPLILAADFVAGIIVRICGLVSASPYSYASTERTWLFVLWGVVGSALFVSCALAKKRRVSDLVNCSAAYILICVLAAWL